MGNKNKPSRKECSERELHNLPEEVGSSLIKDNGNYQVVE